MGIVYNGTEIEELRYKVADNDTDPISYPNIYVENLTTGIAAYIPSDCERHMLLGPGENWNEQRPLSFEFEYFRNGRIMIYKWGFDACTIRFKKSPESSEYIERNFAYGEDVQHLIYIEATKGITCYNTNENVKIKDLFYAQAMDHYNLDLEEWDTTNSRNKYYDSIICSLCWYNFSTHAYEPVGDPVIVRPCIESQLPFNQDIIYLKYAGFPDYYTDDWGLVTYKLSTSQATRTTTKWLYMRVFTSFDNYSKGESYVDVSIVDTSGYWDRAAAVIDRYKKHLDVPFSGEHVTENIDIALTQRIIKNLLYLKPNEFDYCGIHVTIDANGIVTLNGTAINDGSIKLGDFTGDDSLLLNGAPDSGSDDTYGLYFLKYPYPNYLENTLTAIKALNTDGTWNGDVYTINGVTFTCYTDAYGVVTKVVANGTPTSGTGETYAAKLYLKTLVKEDFASPDSWTDYYTRMSYSASSEDYGVSLGMDTYLNGSLASEDRFSASGPQTYDSYFDQWDTSYNTIKAYLGLRYQRDSVSNCSASPSLTYYPDIREGDKQHGADVRVYPTEYSELTLYFDRERVFDNVVFRPMMRKDYISDGTFQRYNEPYDYPFPEVQGTITAYIDDGKLTVDNHAGTGVQFDLVFYDERLGEIGHTTISVQDNETKTPDYKVTTGEALLMCFFDEQDYNEFYQGYFYSGDSSNPKYLDERWTSWDILYRIYDSSAATYHDFVMLSEITPDSSKATYEDYVYLTQEIAKNRDLPIIRQKNNKQIYGITGSSEHLHSTLSGTLAYMTFDWTNGYVNKSATFNLTLDGASASFQYTTNYPSPHNIAKVTLSYISKNGRAALKAVIGENDIDPGSYINWKFKDLVLSSVVDGTTITANVPNERLYNDWEGPEGDADRGKYIFDVLSTATKTNSDGSYPLEDHYIPNDKAKYYTHTYGWIDSNN